MVGSISFDTRLRDQFGRLRGLTDDWDGQGAMAPKSEAIAEAERWLTLLIQQRWPEPARVYSLSTGEVVAEWDHGTDHFEIEFSGTGRVSWMSSGSAMPTVHGLLPQVDTTYTSLA